MKQIYYIFLYLNIYTGFFSLAHSQEITLTVSFETRVSKTLEEALAISTKHQNFKSVREEAERLSKKLETFGYLENSLESMKRISDSTAAAHFYLGKRYTQLKIDYSNTPFTEDEIALISKKTKENYCR